MNKRIEELAEQCTTIYNSATFPVDKDFDYEKFAELIVRECSDYAHKCILEDESDFPVKSVAYRIKEHFGVEE